MRTRPFCAAVMAVLALVGGTACGSDDESSGTSGTDSPTTTALSDQAADAKSGVTLDDPGSEPRQRLTLRIAPGTTTKAAFVTKLTLEMTADGRALPVGAVPTTRLVFEQHADRVDPDGTVHYSLVFTDVSVLRTPGASTDVVQGTQKLLDQLKGLRGTGSVDAQGGNQTASFDTSRITDANLTTLDSTASQVSNLSAPFPRPPVGLGARWTVKRTATINGITMNTSTRYTLRSRSGDRYELDVVQEAEAPPGPAALPNLPASTTVSIKRFVMQSKGEVASDLTRQVPEKSTMAGEGDGEFTFREGGSSGLVQHLTTDLTLSPA